MGILSGGWQWWGLGGWIGQHHADFSLSPTRGLPTRWASLDLDFKILIPELQDDGTDLPKVLRCGGSKLVDRTIEGFGPKLDQPGLAAERVCTSFFSGLRKKQPSVFLSVPMHPCTLLLAGAGRQVASGDGLICAKPD